MYQPYLGAAEMVWLAGLGAVVLLWQRSSRAFFNGRQP